MTYRHLGRRGLRRIVLLAVASVTAVAATAATASAGETAESSDIGATPHTYANFSFDQRSVHQVDWPATMKTDPGNANVFWSNQFGFTNDSTGYFGMQTHRDGGGMFLVSIWGTTDAKTGSNGSYCKTFSEDGSGKSCRIDKRPKPGHDYVFHASAAANGWWKFTVTDETAHTAMTLGTIQVADGAEMTSKDFVSWTEYFDWNNPKATCMDEPYSKLKLGRPTANDGNLSATWTDTSVKDDCYGTSKVTESAGGSMIEENAIGSSAAGNITASDARCVGAASDKAGATAQLQRCSTADEQNFVHAPDGSLRAKNWQCLDVKTADDKTTVKFSGCNASRDQIWWPRDNGTIHHTGTGKCLAAADLDGSDRLTVKKCDAGDRAQQFTMPHPN